MAGFALGNLQSGKVDPAFMDVAVYMMSCIAVHACTCSCLMSAFLYQKCNGLSEEQLSHWARSNEFLLSMPFLKFVMGCVCYLVSVVCLSFRDLAETPSAMYVAGGIGVMSVSSVFVTATYIHCRSPRSNFFEKA